MYTRMFGIALIAVSALKVQAATYYTATEQYVQNVVKAESNRTDVAIKELRKEIQDANYLTTSAIKGGMNVSVSTNSTGDVIIDAYASGEADFTTNNTELVQTIQTVAPAPADYATVSNKAMNALSNEAAKNGFTEWECDPGYLDGRLEVVPDGISWALMRDVNGESILVERIPFSGKATTLEFPVVGVTATRVRIPTLEDIPTNNVQLVNGAEYVSASELATVATSGAYSDLTGVPTKISDFTNDEGFVNASVTNGLSSIEYVNDATNGLVSTSELATVATSGAYSDLTGVPTKISDFTNDEGFVNASVTNGLATIADLKGIVQLTITTQNNSLIFSTNNVSGAILGGMRGSERSQLPPR